MALLIVVMSLNDLAFFAWDYYWYIHISIVPLPPGVVAETRRRARTRDPDGPSCLCVPQDAEARNLFLFIEAVRNSALLLPSLAGIYVRISDE
jgi:hypothetical protein